MQTQDELLKGLIEDLPYAFLKKFYPVLYAQIDFKHPKPIVFLDKELSRLHAKSKIGQKRVDKLFAVHLKGVVEPKIVYSHVEFQGYPDNEYGKRNFIYYYRLFDLFGENVTTLTIFTGDNPKHEPSTFIHEFSGVRVQFDYPIFRISDRKSVV